MDAEVSGQQNKRQKIDCSKCIKESDATAAKFDRVLVLTLPFMWIIAYCQAAVMYNVMTDIPLLSLGFSHSLVARSNELLFISILAFKCYFLNRISGNISQSSTKIWLSQLFNLRENQPGVELDFGSKIVNSDFLVGDLKCQSNGMIDLDKLRTARGTHDYDIATRINNSLKTLPLFYIRAVDDSFGDSFVICQPPIIIQSKLTITGQETSSDKVIKMIYN